RVDYCLTVNGIDPERARRLLEGAMEPVELWFQQPGDNPELARKLQEAGCQPERFGYWWKWFPARSRPEASGLNLDGDMVLVREPAWFERWRIGDRRPKVTSHPGCIPETYGRYADWVDERHLYSGLLALPPRFDWNARLHDVLDARPLG